MRASTNIQLKERRHFKIDDFRGVDYSTSPLKVQTNRASNMVNFISEYGINKKRNGWIELIKIEDSDGNPRKINGIFDYRNGEHQETIVHAGKGIYRLVYDDTSGIYSYTQLFITYLNDEFEDSKSQAFLNKGRLYIIGCGDYLVYGSWDGGITYHLRRVIEAKDTYTPTTTIGIKDNTVTDRKSKRFENINILTKRRTNKLLGTNTITTETLWTLDSSICNITEVTVKIETIIEGKKVTLFAENYLYQDLRLAKDCIIDGEKVTLPDKSESEDSYLTNDCSIDDLKCGSKCGVVYYTAGKIFLSIRNAPQAENMDNISVTFYADSSSDERYNRIRKCNFGVLFGAGGNSDRLFLSGNPDYKNMDFYSDIGNFGYSDFTYFPDTNASIIGSEANPITGYLRLSDSSLAICKRENACESTIFYRTGKYESVTIDGIEVTNVKAVFKETAGNATNGCVNSFTCHNFCGDSIILSESGVCGLVLINSFTTERGVRERSFSINEKLMKHNLSEAVGIVYKNKYYLAVDGVCYVADAKFKYAKENDIDGSFNYEWWNWDNVSARVFVNLNNKLYFGSDDGKICVFDDEYSDRTLYVSKEGDIAMDKNNNQFIYNKKIGFDIKENDIVQLYNMYSFETKTVYFNTYIIKALCNCGYDCNCDRNGVCDILKIEQNKIYVKPELIMPCREGLWVLPYAGVGYNNFDPTRHNYYLCNVDYALACFSICDELGEVVKINNTSKYFYERFWLVRNLVGEKLYITNVTENSFQLKYFKDKDYDSIVSFGKFYTEAQYQPRLRITHSENIVAKWFTPIMDLGTNESSKTLIKMTIVTEPTIKGELSFGYETQRTQKMIKAQGINVFSFDDFSFENFSFDTEFARSYSVMVHDRDFNFIIFKFVSDNDKNCAVSSFEIVYKINKSNMGVV